MHRVLILGAGGHAQVAADALLRAQEVTPTVELVGFFDDDPQLIGTNILDLPVLGSLAELRRLAHDTTFVAIGDNRTRAKLFAQLVDANEQVVNIIHPKSVLSPTLRMGSGILVCAGVVVNTGTTIGDNTILNTGATVDHHCSIGRHCHIAPGVHLGGGVQVGEGTFLGIGSVVVPGRHIGCWSVIGAGSVVTKDIPDHVVAVGVPARVIKILPTE